MKAALTAAWDVVRYLVAAGLLYVFFRPLVRFLWSLTAMGVASEETGHRYIRLLTRWRMARKEDD